jgi:prepilin-type N-terminal cleavage/methylation domain-containing protein
MLQRVKKAFTLVELIVVVVVLGIIAALAIATFATVRENAACSVALQTAEGIARNANAIASFEGTGTTGDHINTAAGEAVNGGSSTWDNATDTVTVSTNGETGTATVTGNPAAAAASGSCA